MGRFHVHADGTAHTHPDGAAHTHADTPAAPAGTPADAPAGAPAGAHAGAEVDRVDVGDHTAYRTGRERVEVLERILGENDTVAAANRAALDAAGVVGVNLMSSPGAGKTALLARTLPELAARGVRAGVVVGDIETALDADRLAGHGAQVSLVNTAAGFGGECHLDAPMVARGLAGLDLAALDLLLVENVGNLVCPAEFDVGVHHRVMVASVTEGEEKPLKYPVMFRAVELVLLNKVDLVPHLDVDLDLFEHNVYAVNPRARLLHLSARTGEGVGAWLEWLAGIRT